MEGTHLEFVLEQVFLVGHLAIHAEQALLVGGHGLGGAGEYLYCFCDRWEVEVGRVGDTHADIDLVLLVRIHDAGGEECRREEKRRRGVGRKRKEEEEECDRKRRDDDGLWSIDNTRGYSAP